MELPREEMLKEFEDAIESAIRFERDPENPRHFHTIRGVGYRFTRERRGGPDDE